MSEDKELPVNNASIMQTTDEVNPKLIALVADQITALNGTITKFIIAFVILIVVLILSIGTTITLQYTTYKKMSQVEHDNGLTKKHIWELKRALELDFSYERSAKKED